MKNDIQQVTETIKDIRKMRSQITSKEKAKGLYNETWATHMALDVVGQNCIRDIENIGLRNERDHLSVLMTQRESNYQYYYGYRKRMKELIVVLKNYRASLHEKNMNKYVFWLTAIGVLVAIIFGIIGMLK